MTPRRFAACSFPANMARPSRPCSDYRTNTRKQPNDKPLRIKRGHRKVSTIVEDGREDGQPDSPTQEASSRGSKRAKGANGTRRSIKPTKAKTAFDLYCDETRPILEAKNADDMNVEDELTKGWEDLAESDKQSYQKKAAKDEIKDEEEKEASAEPDVDHEKENNDDKDEEKDDDRDDKDGAKAGDRVERKGDGEVDGEDEDVEMANYDTEEQ